MQAGHANRLGILLLALDSSATAADMDIPGFKPHALKATHPVRWSVWVSGNWRMTFECYAGDAHVVDYEDYHS